MSAQCFASTVQAQGPDRGGFTLLLDLGVGFQHDKAIGETKVGLAGLNLGIGGFATDNIAIMFRIAGTNVGYSGAYQVSGVVGPTIQYWKSDRLSLEGGVDLGFWDIEGVSQNGLGFILGASYAFFNRGKHNLQIGAIYSPALTDSGTVHNIGLVFGWQLL